MRVKGIRIRNVLGVAELEIAPGSVTVVSGQNASGKTSVIEALRAVVNGGHDATLLRKGADDGEVVLVIACDDGHDVEVTKSIGREKSSTRIEHEILGKLPKPAAWLRERIDGLGFNPAAFLTMTDKQRADELLKTLDRELSDSELLEALGVDFPGVYLQALSELAIGVGPALTVIDRADKQVREWRRTQNVKGKELKAAVAKLGEGLPDQGQAFDAGTLGGAEAELEAFKQGHETQVREMRDAHRLRVAGLGRARDEKMAQAQDDYDAACKTAHAEHEGERAQAEAGYTDAIEELDDPYRPELEQRTTAIGALKAQVDASLKAAGAREELERMKLEGTQAEEQAHRLNAAVAGLADLKLEIIKALPFENVEVVAGELVVDGKPFDRLSTAEQTRFAFEIAKLRAGELGLVACDGLECLDAERLAAFEAAARDAADGGLQLVYTVVKDSPFSVDSIA